MTHNKKLVRTSKTRGYQRVLIMIIFAVLVNGTILAAIGEGPDGDPVQGEDVNGEQNQDCDCTPDQEQNRDCDENGEQNQEQNGEGSGDGEGTQNQEQNGVGTHNQEQKRYMNGDCTYSCSGVMY